ncbi:MAG: PD-(D/E)XK nuclease family protein [Chloroflexota bacterium]
MKLYTLSPSDLTFLWDGCKFCFYMKVKHKIIYRGPFPGMFGTMGNLTSNYYQGKPTSAISPDLPVGMIKYKEKWVKSIPIFFPGMTSQCVIRGRFDAVIAFEDGSYGIIDYKTSDASSEKAAFYSRQLSAYAYALENPAPGALSFAPITRLGLFIITPQRYELVSREEAAFITRTTWMDVPREDTGFLAFLGEVMAVLDSPHPPTSAEDCALCSYRQSMAEFEGEKGGAQEFKGW